MHNSFVRQHYLRILERSVLPRPDRERSLFSSDEPRRGGLRLLASLSLSERWVVEAAARLLAQELTRAQRRRTHTSRPDADASHTRESFGGGREGFTGS